jgi:hypothetical protein
MANYPAPRKPDPAEMADFCAPEPGWRGGVLARAEPGLTDT